MILMCCQRNKMKNKNATSSEQFNEKFGEIHLIVMWYLIDSYEKQIGNVVYILHRNRWLHKY